ncbi:UDP-glucose 4-epimerase GalE [Deinococcus ruber]|uniref:UDP-glucose 4-epimerase GalE n=1 Tax=Deinococcus ruber TaxID=1848197 RepID=UPI001668AA04|nr:UDP-glucose 4-epimerase GalE [Deinococcus ruber]
MKVLVTGGAGYIGSTVCAALEDAGHIPVVLDSLVTGSPDFVANRIFYKGDIADQGLLRRLFQEHPDIAATLHFAARVILPESVEQPALYYRENVMKSLTLFENLLALGQQRVVFSSSASVYDTVADFRVTEDSPLNPSSPYARSKWMMEQILEDLCIASASHPPGLRALALRYFNPIGADPKERSGPYQQQPTHLLGRLLSAAQSGTPFSITGTDYVTRDGTGLRDYIHVWDLALAHVAAVEQFDQVFLKASSEQQPAVRFLTINLGTGNGVTVREFVRAFQEAVDVPLQVTEAPRRPGDGAGAYADISRAHTLLGWRPTLSVTQGIASALNWARRPRTVRS